MQSQKEKYFHQEFIEQLITLTTSGFGLVAALAWNEAVQAFVKENIESYFPQSGLISKFLYALIITLFAVLITFQLSRLASKFNQK